MTKDKMTIEIHSEDPIIQITQIIKEWISKEKEVDQSGVYSPFTLYNYTTNNLFDIRYALYEFRDKLKGALDEWDKMEETSLHSDEEDSELKQLINMTNYKFAQLEHIIRFMDEARMFFPHSKENPYARPKKITKKEVNQIINKKIENAFETYYEMELILDTFMKDHNYDYRLTSYSHHKIIK